MDKRVSTRSLVVLMLFVAWGLLSWHWYTCWIKGFCGAAPTVVAGETATVPAGERAAAVAVPDAGVTKDCAPYLRDKMRRSMTNDPAEVRKLEKFLAEDGNETLPSDGVYGADDEAAVRRFQARHADEVLRPWGISEPTGHVLDTTRAAINRIVCGRAGK